MKKIILSAFLILLFVGCGKSNELKKIEKEKFLFGTYIKMIVFSENKEVADKAIEAAFNKIGEIDNKYNSKTRGSLIYKLNHSENKEIILDDEGVYLFKNIKKIYQISNKKYDITISPLLDLWGFGKKPRETVPSESEIKEALKKVDFSKVILEGNKLILKDPVKEIDTGSFLKGYAIEKGKEVLKENGIKSGFITSVSSIAAIGEKPDQKPWKIGIQNPSNLQEILGIVKINDKSLGISGDYQIYVEIQGKKYHHIMDKATGFPVKDKKLVVVIADSAFLADMYSTAFFNMKTSDILRKSEELNVKILVIDSQNNIQTTKNFHLEQ